MISHRQLKKYESCDYTVEWLEGKTWMSSSTLIHIQMIFFCKDMYLYYKNYLCTNINIYIYVSIFIGK